MSSIEWAFGWPCMLFKDAIDQFSGWRQIKVTGPYGQTIRQGISHLCLYLKNPHIENITIQHVMDYLNLMTELGWKRNGIRIVTLALKKFFEFYNLQGLRLSMNFLFQPQERIQHTSNCN